MEPITRKKEVSDRLEQCLASYDSEGISAFVLKLNHLLQHKVKFPLLEYCAKEIHGHVASADHIRVCKAVAGLHTIGGNVLIGIILQQRLGDHFQESLEKAAEYIIEGNEWYCSDIIGERVFGYSLLTEPEKTLPALKKLAGHHSSWVVRSIGAGSHYAIKKGLGASDVEQVFQLLLSLSDVRDYHTKRGIGWAAKTTAKFHPELIRKYEKALNQPGVGKWFRTKIEIGLKRNRYAQGNTG